MFKHIEEVGFFLNVITFVLEQDFLSEQGTLSHQTLLLNHDDASGNVIIANIMSSFTIMADSSLLVLRAAVVMESQNLRQKWNSLHCLWSAFTIKFQHQTLNIVVYLVAMETQCREDGLFPKLDMTNMD